MIRPLKQRHVHVLARNVVHGRITCLAQCQCALRIGDNASCDLDDDTMGIALDRDRVVPAGDLDGLRLWLCLV